MIDQLMIGAKASYDDFEASVAKREIKAPKKKTIKQSVPFSNVVYDFSAINGEVYWEERELVYTFELTAPTPEELEDLKTAFVRWVMHVQDEELRDPHIFGYHFRATYDDMEVEDDEGMDKTTLTVTFKAYPYKLADHATIIYESTIPKSMNALEGMNDLVGVRNTSDHPVALTVLTEEPSTWVSIKGPFGTIKHPQGETHPVTYGSALLPVGDSTLTVTNKSTEAGARVRLSYVEEVM